jgi:hypothetical protein
VSATRSAPGSTAASCSAEFDANGQHILSSMLCDNGQGGTTPCYSGTTPVAPTCSSAAATRARGYVLVDVTLGERVRLYGMMDFKTGFKKWDHVTRVRCSLNNICHENVAPLEYVSTAPERLAAYQTADQMGAEYIRDSKFLRLREVSASYIVPSRFIERFGASRARSTWPPATCTRGRLDGHGPGGALPERRPRRLRPARAEPPAAADVDRHHHQPQLLGDDDENTRPSTAFTAMR